MRINYIPEWIDTNHLKITRASVERYDGPAAVMTEPTGELAATDPQGDTIQLKRDDLGNNTVDYVPHDGGNPKPHFVREDEGYELQRALSRAQFEDNSLTTQAAAGYLIGDLYRSRGGAC